MTQQPGPYGQPDPYASQGAYGQQQPPQYPATEPFPAVRSGGEPFPQQPNPAASLPYEQRNSFPGAQQYDPYAPAYATTPAPQGYYPAVASQGAPFGIDPLTGLPYSDKSKLVAGLLQLFFGGLGVGRFYMGNIGMGIAQIAVTFLTLGFGVLWPVIDGIIILAGHPRDSYGRPLRS